MKFEDFKLQLENYAENSSFPKIDDWWKIINIAIVGLGQIVLSLQWD